MTSSIKYINLDQVVSITANYREIYDDVVFLPYRKTGFLRQEREEGFHVVSLFSVYFLISLEDARNSKIYKVIDNHLYCKPHIVIEMTNGENHKEYFNTPLELDEVIDRLKAEGSNYRVVKSHEQ